MMRSSVVLPDPDGPSSASNSPSPTLRSTLSSAVNAPNFFTMFFSSIGTQQRPLVQTPLENRFRHQRDQRQHGEQGSDRERRYELIFVVENLDQQRHGV